MWRFGFALAVVTFISVNALAQEEQEDPASHHKEWKTYFTEVAKGYSMEADKKGSKPFKVTPKPVHSYYNSGGGEYNHGTFFFWTQDGRPAAIGQLWCYGRLSGGTATVVHEMHSLTQEPFQAILPGQASAFWSPRKGGVKLKTLRKGVTAPKGRRSIRMAQMRSLAREFTGFVHRRTGKEELRMHQQPLFRYEENKKRKRILDGAVFAFFSDWDPELILVVEANKEGNASSWQYAGVRLCNVPVSLKRGGTEVWKVEEAPFLGGRVNGPNDPYYARHGVAFVEPTRLIATKDTK